MGLKAALSLLCSMATSNHDNDTFHLPFIRLNNVFMMLLTKLQ